MRREILPYTWQTKIDQPERRIKWGYKPKPHDWSRIDKGWLDPRILAEIPGRSGEHLVFARTRTGRKDAATWRRFVASIKRRGLDFPVDIRKEYDGSVEIFEGNHRIRAAIEAGLDKIPAILQYYGGSEETGLIYNPETNIFSSTGEA